MTGLNGLKNDENLSSMNFGGCQELLRNTCGVGVLKNLIKVYGVYKELKMKKN